MFTLSRSLEPACRVLSPTLFHCHQSLNTRASSYITKCRECRDIEAVRGQACAFFCSRPRQRKKGHTSRYSITQCTMLLWVRASCPLDAFATLDSLYSVIWILRCIHHHGPATVVALPIQLIASTCISHRCDTQSFLIMLSLGLAEDTKVLMACRIDIQTSHQIPSSPVCNPHSPIMCQSPPTASLAASYVCPLLPSCVCLGASFLYR